MIDVRAPAEFNKGAFPGAINLPILNDAEREAVGICYKQEGPESALELGHQLVCAEPKTLRVNAWLDFVERHPDALLYCFRGGQRSKIACQWMAETGVNIERVEGGYKAMRQHLLGVFERLPAILVIAGPTGSGKTELLQQFTETVDLEGIANHRGSAFGGKLTAQPSQINFENQIAIEFLKRQAGPVLLEDEGRLIGRLHLPAILQEAMKQAPVILIEESVESRTDRIYGEYIVEGWQEYQKAYPKGALKAYSDYLLNAVDAIRKRLGNVAHAEIRHTMQQALQQQARQDSSEGHKHWIRQLLVDYYDPMYRYQLEQKRQRITQTGNLDTLVAWLRDALQTDPAALVTKQRRLMAPATRQIN